MKRLLLLPLLAVLVLAGCKSGQNANTTVQRETGSGIKFAAESVVVQSAVVVAGEGAEEGTVSAVVVNTGMDADQLKSITVGGKQASIEPSNVELLPQRAVTIRPGGDVTATVPLGSASVGDFVEMTFAFADSGLATEQVLVVPDTGIYASLAPSKGPMDSDPASND